MNKQNLKEKEEEYLSNVVDEINELKKELNSSNINKYNVYRSIIKIKELGNVHLHFIGLIHAKDFLLSKHESLSNFDVSEKAQGSNGLDIDEKTSDGLRIIAEIKTTIPYDPKKKDKLGSVQETSFLNDFKKLKKEEAEFKYFFVTDQKVFEIVNNQYLNKMIGIIPVFLDLKMKLPILHALEQ